MYEPSAKSIHLSFNDAALQGSASPEPLQDNIFNGRISREMLAASLRGNVLRIPDLGKAMVNWPASVNPALDRLRVDLEILITKLFPRGRRRAKLIAADPGYFAASWWPYASYERLLVAAQLSLWLFAWDDETDSAEFSEKIHSLEQGRKFREATLSWVRSSLDIKPEIPQLDKKDDSETASQIPVNRLFSPVAKALVKHCSLEQRKVLISQIELFIRMCEVEQQVQLEKALPSISDYWQRRRGTSAVLVVLAIHEYTLEISLSQQTWRSCLFQELCEETNIIISVVNDILSFKKELDQHQVDSLIPLLCHEYDIGVQEAVNTASEICCLSVGRLEDVSRRLLSDTDMSTHTSTDDMQKFVDSCKYACTANLNWSLMSGRYNLAIANLTEFVSITL